MPLDTFSLRVLATERQKLKAVQDKISKAIEAKDVARLAGLAQPAAAIAQRLAILLDQQRIK